MKTLLELQQLEFGPEADSPSIKSAVEKLRAQVPYQILGHYDRLRARGKKGMALVRNQVCAECHMSVPIGTVVTVTKGLDIELCGNCGRYLYVQVPVPEPQAVPEVPQKKSVRRMKGKAA